MFIDAILYFRRKKKNKKKQAVNGGKEKKMFCEGVNTLLSFFFVTITLNV